MRQTNRVVLGLALLLIYLLLAACGSTPDELEKTSAVETVASTQSTFTRTPAPTSTSVPSTVTPTSIPTTTYLMDEPIGHLVWFCPNYDGAMTNYVPPDDGSIFFQSNSLHQLSDDGLDVYKFYIGNVYDTSFPLEEAIEELKQAKIAIGIEAGGLRDWNCSGIGLALHEYQAIRRIVNYGGKVDYIALDSPFAHTLASGMPNACNFTPEEASYQLSAYIRTIRIYSPAVKIGIIEPVPWYTVGKFPNNYGNNFGDLIYLLDTLLSVLEEQGQEIAFFHADSPYDYNISVYKDQGWDKLRELQEQVQNRGLRFGIIYNSELAGETSDEVFFDETKLFWKNHMETGEIPDDIILQSWYWYPRSWLPIDEPYSYSNLLRFILDSEQLNHPNP